MVLISIYNDYIATTLRKLEILCGNTLDYDKYMTITDTKYLRSNFDDLNRHDIQTVMDSPMILLKSIYYFLHTLNK